MDWPAAYEPILERLDAFVAAARPTLCGLSVCVDATVSLHAAGALLAAAGPAQAVELAGMLCERARRGVGGEIRVDWAAGPEWLDRHVPFTLALGGTGPHAARVLGVLGAPALLALATRSPEQLGVLDPALMLAQDGRAVAATAIRVTCPNATKIYIFEYTKDRPLADFAPPRSSRVIVRFNDSGLEYDTEFAALSCASASQAGAALLSGFTTVPTSELGAALAYARDLTVRWRAAGIPAVHLELAGYERSGDRDSVLRELCGPVTSLGASLSEFVALAPEPDLAAAMCAVGDRYGLRRVCVHADGWAATATRDDPERERDALLVGNLLASVRAEHGRPAVPRMLPAGARFDSPPALPQRRGGWHIVACAAPYLDRPAATVGLGDTFTAGCLLVLGGGPVPSLSTCTPIGHNAP